MATNANALFRLEGEGLPADVLVVRYEALEAISTPYEVTVEFMTDDRSFRIDSVLRKPLLLTVVNEKGETRRFHGVVDRARFAKIAAKRLYFSVRMRPALAALAHREDSRIFQNKSIVDVITKIFEEAGFKDHVQWQLIGTYEPKEFIVQYRETAFNFVSRLMEHEGIFYFFQHKPDGHTMVVADSNDAFVLMDDAPPAQLALAQGALSFMGDPIEEFTRTRSIRTTAGTMRDFDFEKPGLKPETKLAKDDAWSNNYYEYPGGFVKTAEAKQRLGARMRELRRDADVCRGASEAIGLRCGVPFTVDGAAEGCLNGEYIVTSLFSTGKQNPEVEHENYACRNEFSGIPKDLPYGPPRLALRPRIRGVQTAVVTGPTSQEQAIHVDKYGRIKVRFYWDRVGQQDDTSSCWLRVAQVHQGGSMILPRVGWEVSIAFLDGDPDRPIVLGRVYNGEKTPPYALPGAKSSGSLKSMSSPGGAGHNEIKMSDSGGSQGFGVTAQKDFNITIGHDKTEKIAVDDKTSVTVNMSNSVGSNETISVGGNQALDVGANLTHNISGKQSVSVGGNDTSNADSNYVEKVGGAREYTIGGNRMILQNGIQHLVQGNLNRTVGALQLTASVASIVENVLGNFNSNVGAVTAQLVKGNVGETVAGTKNLTSTAAELHVLKGSYTGACDASVTTMVGGLHYQKINGDFAVSGKMITLLGAVGDFKAGGSVLKLGGGPITMKGSVVMHQGAMLVRAGASLKMGTG